MASSFRSLARVAFFPCLPNSRTLQRLDLALISLLGLLVNVVGIVAFVLSHPTRMRVECLRVHLPPGLSLAWILEIQKRATMTDILISIDCELKTVLCVWRSLEYQMRLTRWGVRKGKERVEKREEEDDRKKGDTSKWEERSELTGLGQERWKDIGFTSHSSRLQSKIGLQRQKRNDMIDLFSGGNFWSIWIVRSNYSRLPNSFLWPVSRIMFYLSLHSLKQFRPYLNFYENVRTRSQTTKFLNSSPLCLLISYCLICSPVMDGFSTILSAVTQWLFEQRAIDINVSASPGHSSEHVILLALRSSPSMGRWSLLDCLIFLVSPQSIGQSMSGIVLGLNGLALHYQLSD